MIIYSSPDIRLCLLDISDYTGIDIQQLLVASHIIPWAKNKEERLNPANGICLSSLYDDAFDKGFIGFDKNYRVVLSDRLQEHPKKHTTTPFSVL